MDDQDVVARLERIERQLQTVVAFTTRLEALFGAWLNGGKGRLLAAAIKLRSDQR